MRTPEQIVHRMQHQQDLDEDLLGFKAEVLVSFLTFDQAKPLLKPDTNPENWTEVSPLTEDEVLRQMRNYMIFAWQKAIDHRGISASRSVEKIGEWLWLLEEESVIVGVPYPQYGVPLLLKVCEAFEFQIPTVAGGPDVIARMGRGEPCERACQNGCGR